jgi:predicted lipoprotein with Yx(FWY)xxD motif
MTPDTQTPRDAIAEAAAKLSAQADRMMRAAQSLHRSPGPLRMASRARRPLESDTNKSSNQATNADYMSSNNGYMGNTSIGSVLTNPQGMTVYTFDKDQSGASTCYGECATHWPPVTAGNDVQAYGHMTLVSRNDGQRQWAYDSKPIYTYHDDMMRGDVEGDNVGGVWHVVR